MSAKYFDQITAGMAYCDSNPDPVFAGWREKIDLSILNMEISELCIIGQVAGGFEAHRYEDKDFDPYTLGFMTRRPDKRQQWHNDEITWHEYSGALTEEYKTLTAEWKAALTGHPSFCKGK